MVAASRLGSGQPVADADNSRRRLTLLGVGPAPENPADGRPLGESMLTRERYAIIAVAADGGEISGEDQALPANARAWASVWACPSSRLNASARSAARAD